MPDLGRHLWGLAVTEVAHCVTFQCWKPIVASPRHFFFFWWYWGLLGRHPTTWATPPALTITLFRSSLSWPLPLGPWGWIQSKLLNAQIDKWINRNYRLNFWSKNPKSFWVFQISVSWIRDTCLVKSMQISPNPKSSQIWDTSDLRCFR
jgi:hypothetical protein